MKNSHNYAFKKRLYERQGRPLPTNSVCGLQDLSLEQGEPVELTEVSNAATETEGSPGAIWYMPLSRAGLDAIHSIAEASLRIDDQTA